ncbi:MAG: hypothetical protein M3R70_09080 [Actinomycetota bacterium]|nr:hypothetical protein [Actinomycetota bacterium]
MHNDAVPGTTVVAQEKSPALERVIAPVRLYGIRSFLIAVSVVGVVAGILSASTITLPLLVYVGMAVGVFLLAVLALTFSQPRYKFLLFSLFYRRPVKRDAAGRPRYRHLYGEAPDAAVLQVAAGRKIDPVYEGGFRALLDSHDPIALIATSPRDVSDPTKLPAGMFNPRGSRTDCAVDPTEFGIALDPYVFERERSEGTQDTDHMLATKDLVYLANLGQALRVEAGTSAASEPFIWPEHCVDLPFLTNHDLCVVGGGDTNFWHAALFEPVYQSFNDPPSTVPLAVDLRELENPFYSSRTINVRLAGRERIPGLEGARRFELDERNFPTCGMILAVENPYARASERNHWCVFIAGTRSLGTAGAMLGLAAMIERMRADEGVNYFSAVETSEPGVLGHVSALVTRVTEVEYAAETGRDRARYAVATDRPDPEYRDSFMPLTVEYLDNLGETPEWKLLVTLRAPEGDGDQAQQKEAGRVAV